MTVAHTIVMIINALKVHVFEKLALHSFKKKKD